ncbi:MAG: hypothetical protein PHO83_10300 [Geobacteraceae bacterium]|nr:hypothetical protein [Geobacteraceae bacterium]
MRHLRRHTWLFSFTDVAFLLLLVYTQLARMSTDSTPVAEMRLPAPTVANNPELISMRVSSDYRQVLVEKHSDRPFRLTRVVGGNEMTRSEAMNQEELRAALQAIFAEKKGQLRPVIVPLPESFSSDLLQVTALISKLWREDANPVVHINEEKKAS